MNDTKPFTKQNNKEENKKYTYYIQRVLANLETFLICGCKKLRSSTLR